MNKQVICEVDGSFYGVDSMSVRSIETGKVEMLLGNVPDFVEGIIKFRGEWVPIIKMRGLFGLNRGVEREYTQIIFMQTGNGTFGFRFDNVVEIDFIGDTIQNIPIILNSGKTAFISGACSHNGRLIIIADHEKFLDADSLKRIKEGLKAVYDAEAAEKRRKEEEERKKAEEEARKKAEAEARKKAEEEARKKAEAEARKKAEEEARKKAEAEARKKAEEEARKKAEAEAAKKAEEEAKCRAEEEAKLRAQEEAEKKKEEALIKETAENVTESVSKEKKESTKEEKIAEKDSEISKKAAKKSGKKASGKSKKDKNK